MRTVAAPQLRAPACGFRRSVEGVIACLPAAGALVVLLLGTLPVQAQLFGPRDLTGALSPRNAPGSTLSSSVGSGGSTTSGAGSSSSGGNVSVLAQIGQALRESRASDSFVGSDTGDLGRFIGTAQTEGNAVRSTLPTIILPPRSNVNREAPTLTGDPRRRLYPPRLRIGFPPVTGDLEPQFTAQIESRLQQALGQAIRVTLSQRTATLEGQVPSSHLRTLAEQLVRFEPGVSTVDNRLTVDANDPFLEDQPAAEPAAR